MMVLKPRLVCLVGAECTGKTTLARALAQRLNGLWVPEYLRHFTDQQGRTPQRQEQQHILQQQLRLESQAQEWALQQQRSWVFCDTGPMLTAVYSECVFSDESLYLQALALRGRYALTLLLEPDLPWQADGAQRDGVEMRGKVHAVLQRVLTQNAWPLVRIGGSGEHRLRAAVDAVLQVTPAPLQTLPGSAGSG